MEQIEKIHRGQNARKEGKMLLSIYFKDGSSKAIPVSYFHTNENFESLYYNNLNKRKEERLCFSDIAKFVLDYEEETKAKESEEQKEELPFLSQRFEILNCILELASVAGDLSILESQTNEMSDHLFDEMRNLTKALKQF
ncbi:MAG: hypothetical protein IKE41_04805, partial [Clostridia bacterium]|nr:hypothetical protein [Clostridia bacterium]